MLSPKKTARLGVLAILVVLVSCFSVLLARSSEPGTGGVGQLTPPITLQRTDGGMGSLEQYRDKVVVLWFNCIRCPMTNQYISRVARLSADLQKLPQVQLISIHEGPYESIDAIEVQTRIAGIKAPIWLDTDGAAARQLGVASTPTFVVIDASGRIRYIGAQDDDVTGQQVTHRYVRQAINALLNEQPVATQLTQAPGNPIDVRE